MSSASHSNSSSRKNSLEGEGGHPMTHYYDVDLYPKLMREFENHCQHEQLVTTSPTDYDLYPSLMREIENQGARKQPDMLHDWEFRSYRKNWLW
ncbi:hypothetical protein K493DRAFT_319603 [Basidiobolus meristosporus CBS 931.73]|uniref:Uncharacterized protein n=1 Tax=Basidiobolus meristosporus CBS 931.73 TaxID=1314790 RepID=A0A1Y1XQ11_9FUNG|nr:hypothetical protein K493DRAFT_319603 [Basidiobolus meristosporus CBS 931.73]|eukprot:ORX87840.1 hypothetical protein K493DRAFT_319603 [Basidiobolus meristosporus CBS 931.73]